MTVDAGAPHRVARSSAAAGVALVAAAGGHLATGGAALSGPGLLTATAGLALPAWWLTGRERGWGLLAGALVAGQLGAHALFSLTATGHHGAEATAVLQHAGWLPTDLMLLGHLLAAALAATWLRRGERRAWAAVRRAGAALHRTLAVLLGRPVRVLTDVGVVYRDRPENHPGRPSSVLRNTIILRGPPLGG